ncbi:MAG: tetratricopeptide repeat protein [Lachnospiraceae bacterium]|nr:tetratricopeptide repeat protein [Lachnospiraceae bacterium]
MGRALNRLTRGIGALLLFFFFSFLTGCGAGTEHVEEADSLIENGSYQEALESLDVAEQSGENMILIHRSRGIADMGLSDYGTAVDEFTAALSENDGYVKDIDVDISYYLAIAQYRTGDIRGANDTYSAILALYPKESDAYFLRGRTYLALQDIDNAKSDFDKAVKLSPDDPDLYVQIYEALSDAGLSDDGQKYLKSAMELNTKLSAFQQGRLYYCMGDYERAKENLENAVKNGDSQATLYLGRTYEALGDTNYAASLYKSYLDGDPGNAQVMNQLGLCLIDLGDYSGALDAFNKGIDIGDPAMDQSLRFNQIVACENMGDFDRAKTMIQDYLAIYPDDEEAIRENEFLATR